MLMTAPVRLSQEFRMSLWSRKPDIAPRKPPRLLQGQTNPEEENLLSPESSLASATSSGGLSSMLVSPQQMTTSPSASSTSSGGNNSSIVSGGQSSHGQSQPTFSPGYFLQTSPPAPVEELSPGAAAPPQMNKCR